MGRRGRFRTHPSRRPSLTYPRLDCQRQGLAARRLVGYLPSESRSYPELTSEAFLDYLARISRKTISPTRPESLLRRFDISALDQRRKLRDLSHGMKRKLASCRR